MRINPKVESMIGWRLDFNKKTGSLAVRLFPVWLALLLLPLPDTPAQSSLPWTQVDSAGIYVQFHPPNRAVAEDLLAEAVVARREISEFLLYRPTIQVRVLLASDKEDFKNIVKERVPDWGGGVAIPSQGAIILFIPNAARWPKPLQAILRHEISHIFLYHALKGRVVPRWFDEGMAMYQSREWRPEEGLVLARALLFRTLIPLDSLRVNFPAHGGPASLAYQQSFSAINYIVDRYGEDTLKGLIFSLISRKSLDQAMIDEFGVGLPEFEERWTAWLKIRYRWLVLLSRPGVSLGLMTFLFLLAYVVVKLRNRKKLARWDREDKSLAGGQ
ncbi:peptidase MA family metallohydrolase [candidate division KSB1 bacterium]